MSKRRTKHTPATPRPAEFSTTPFAALKKVALAAPPAPKPKEVPPPQSAAVVEEHDLFLDAMSGVRPIKAPKRRQQAAPEPAPRTAAPKSAPSPQEEQADDIFLQEIKRLKMEVTFSEKLPDDGQMTPLSGNRLRMLKRGTLTVNRQLDLHGLTRDEALLELPRFLASARLKGEKAVLVITGKGLNSADGPVLLQAVTSWLRDAGRQLVSEFAPAPGEMGGGGALVVFLKAPPKGEKPVPGQCGSARNPGGGMT